MGLVNRILNRLRFERNKGHAPVMVHGYTRFDNVHLPLTRISNTTYIDSPNKLNIANNVFIGHFNFIDASNGLTIEEGCQLTNYISVLSHSSHISIRLYGKHYTEQKDLIGYVKDGVHIGAYTFVGPHCVIMPGTKLGKGCLVSAYSYVKGEFPDFSIVSGNPAMRVGDTRELDKPFLDANPELKKFSDEWSR